MFVLDYIFYFIMMLMIIAVVVLSMTLISYHGVISLMCFVFLCCVFMSLIGRTFIALIMYIVYLGGLIVVFGYCISIEKGVGNVFGLVSSKIFMVLLTCFGLVVYMWLVYLYGFSGWSVNGDQDCFVRAEINGFGLLYSDGGFGLIVCSWVLFITLFSILVILSWYRRGSIRSF